MCWLTLKSKNTNRSGEQDELSRYRKAKGEEKAEFCLKASFERTNDKVK